nr:RibD C-terminal domain protein [uncultured bacterium]
MKITLVMVMTIDGKIAHNEHQFVNWSSKEDKRSFYAATKQAGAIIMGHHTFDTFPEPLPGRLHIVITSTTEGKTNTPGQVEYTSQSPEEIAAGLDARGYKEAVLAGGAQVNALFLKANLVDEIQLTVEPLIFGSGIDLVRGADLDVRASLISMEKLNESGSIQLRYSIDRG